jgi:hypothetical protein
MFNLSGVESVVENILINLMENQTLLKCLKYTSSDALSQPDLTEDEKMGLLNPDQDFTNVRIFFTPFDYQTTDTTRTELRVFVSEFSPDNHILSKVRIMFQVVVSNHMWRLDAGKQRPLTMISEILKTLHGKEVGAIGELMFLDPFRLKFYNKEYSGYEFSPRTRLS